MDNLDIIILLVIFCPLIAFGIYLFVKARKENKEMYERLNDPVEPEPVETFEVTVAEKDNKILRYGYKTPTHRVAFLISFEFEDGSVRSFEVDERSFRRIPKGAKGELAIVDGKFLGFSRKK